MQKIVCTHADTQMHDTKIEEDNTSAALAAVNTFITTSHAGGLLNWLPVGGTLMRRRHFELLGYTVVSLPFWERREPVQGE
jgi:hypothetical protein